MQFVLCVWHTAPRLESAGVVPAQRKNRRASATLFAMVFTRGTETPTTENEKLMVGTAVFAVLMLLLTHDTACCRCAESLFGVWRKNGRGGGGGCVGAVILLLPLPVVSV